MASRSMSITCRPRRSSSVKGRMSESVTGPPNRVATVGRTLTARPAPNARSAMSVTSWWPALGMAMSTAWAPRAAATSARRLRPPRTGTPIIRRLRFAGSSSSKATGRYGLSGLRIMAMTTWTPPSPAPKTSIFVPACVGRRRRSRTRRHE